MVVICTVIYATNFRVIPIRGYLVMILFLTSGPAPVVSHIALRSATACWTWRVIWLHLEIRRHEWSEGSLLDVMDPTDWRGRGFESRGRKLALNVIINQRHRILSDSLLIRDLFSRADLLVNTDFCLSARFRRYSGYDVVSPYVSLWVQCSLLHNKSESAPFDLG